MHVTGCSVLILEDYGVSFQGRSLHLIDRYRILILKLEAYSNKKVDPSAVAARMAAEISRLTLVVEKEKLQWD